MHILSLIRAFSFVLCCASLSAWCSDAVNNDTALPVALPESNEQIPNHIQADYQQIQTERDNLHKELTSMQKERNDMHDKFNQLQETHLTVQTERDGLQKELANAHNAHQDTQNQLNQLQEKHRTTQNELQQSHENFDRVEADLDTTTTDKEKLHNLYVLADAIIIELNNRVQGFSQHANALSLTLYRYKIALCITAATSVGLCVYNGWSSIKGVCNNVYQRIAQLCTKRTPKRRRIDDELCATPVE